MKQLAFTLLLLTPLYATEEPPQPSPSYSISPVYMIPGVKKRGNVNVLCLDGGGIRGIVQLEFLKALEKATGRACVDIFDLFTGTSIGGITALGLVMPHPIKPRRPKFSAADLYNIYDSPAGRELFSTSIFYKISVLGGLLGPIADHTKIEKLLRSNFGSTKLGQALKPIKVVGYDTTTNKPVFYKSWSEKYKNIPMWQAGRATSAVPSVFEPMKVVGHEIVDGGTVANSTPMEGYISAISLYKGKKPFVLSLGTGRKHVDMYESSILLKIAGIFKISFYTLFNLTLPESASKFVGIERAGALEWLPMILNIMIGGDGQVKDYLMTQFEKQNMVKFMRWNFALDKASASALDTSKENINALSTEAKKALKKVNMEDLIMKLGMSFQTSS